MRYLVIDLGSSSGKIYLARYSEGRKMEMEEIDHFLMNRSRDPGTCSDECLLYIRPDPWGC